MCNYVINKVISSSLIDLLLLNYNLLWNLLFSGTYFLLIVAIAGQNIPTQHSNSKKLM